MNELEECYGCDGRKFVNYVKLKKGEIFSSKTATVVKKCLICKGIGKISNGKFSKD